MAETVAGGGGGGGEERTLQCVQEGQPPAMSRKEKRKALKKEKRKQWRKEVAAKEREEEEARLNDLEEQRRIQLEEEREIERAERERKEFEERERLFLEELARKKTEEEEDEQGRMALEEELQRNQVEHEDQLEKDEGWEYVEEGPPEIIWQGNEIIVKKNRVKVKKKDVDLQRNNEDPDRPTSNPLPPQLEAFTDYQNSSTVSAQQLLDNVAQQIPNFGTEQDKAHCPFHIKTGACRFGSRCSRVHFYPDKSCTLLIKNMYNGPGLAWEQDEGLEYTEEEVERSYEEFYEDVHTEFLKFGEIINFKVCRNGSFHLRGNVYVHYKSLDSAVLAYQSINGRYFASKQVTCEFVGVTRWKVAICGEYMKSRLKTCSRGTACNFIHCFRNPGGDYEWADWDRAPPIFWVKKMAALFGHSREDGYDKEMEQESHGHLKRSSKMLTTERDRYYHKKSRLHNYSNSSHHDESDIRAMKHRRRRTSHEEETYSRNSQRGQKSVCDTDSDSDEVGGRELYKRKCSGLQVKQSKRWDDYQHCKSGSHASDSDGDCSRKDGGRQQDGAKLSSRHGKEATDNLDDHKYTERRTYGSDSNGDWAGEDRERDQHHFQKKKRSRHQHMSSESPNDRQERKQSYDSRSASDRDWSDREADRDRRHYRARKGSKSQEELFEVLDDRYQHKEPSDGNDFSGAGLGGDRDVDKQRSHGTKRSRDWNRVSKSPDDHRKRRPRDIDSDGDVLERDMDIHRSHSRDQSNKMSGMYDHGITEKNLKDKFNCKPSDQSKLELQRVSRQGCSSRQEGLIREPNKGDHVEEELELGKSHEATSYRQSEEQMRHGSSYRSDKEVDEVSRQQCGNDFHKKHQKSKRKYRGDKNFENDSPGRCSKRSKSQDFPHKPDENIGIRGRWQPDLDPEELLAQRK